MRAWLIDQLDSVEKLRLAEVPDVVPGAGHALLRVQYAALNPADAYLAKGEYPAKPPMPHVLGRDGVGTVISAGTGVDQGLVGRKMTILRGPVGVSQWGTFAELVAVPAESLVDVPAGWTDQQAAAATLVYLTAYQALTAWEDLPRRAIVLISGASGGVGVAATQLAKAMGHTIVGLSRSAGKREILKSLGMDITMDPATPVWRKALLAQLGDRRVDLAIDNIGGTLFPELIATLGDRGRVSIVGRLAGPVPEFNTSSILFRRIRIGGIAVGAYTNAESHAAWREVLSLLSRTDAKPLIDSVFTFDQLPAAFARLKDGPMGKVVLKVSEK